MRINFILRKTLFLLIIFSYVKSLSQTNLLNANVTEQVRNPFCGTELLRDYRKWKEEVVEINNLVSTLKHDTCLNKKFSIVFYIVLDSNYLPGVTVGNLTNAINTLNAAFARICVRFENCSTVYIPKYPYNQWQQVPHEMQITSNWYTTQTINFFLVDNVNGNPLNGGYTYMPGTPGNKDVVVMRKTALNPNVLLHLFGHFFGLPDTHAEIAPVPPAVPPPPVPIVTHEWFNRVSSNCYTHGDGFCDTEADPYPVGYNDATIPIPPCFFDYGPLDGLVKYYTPPVDNYMSEYRLSCRCRYTQEQYNFMARVILTQKLYLH